MTITHIQLLLADDDPDDCDLFKEALDELPVSVSLATVHDGEQLMQVLTTKTGVFPQVLFLDLNMPRKNGLECLSALKQDEKLKHLPVIIVSTSFDQEVVNQLYNNGAHYYIRKPTEFRKLKDLIRQALTAVMPDKPSPDQFVLQP